MPGQKGQVTDAMERKPLPEVLVEFTRDNPIGRILLDEWSKANDTPTRMAIYLNIWRLIQVLRDGE